MKRCPGCRTKKPAEEFYADRSHRDGLSSNCRPCTLVQRAAYREANRERLKLQARADRKAEPERGCWHVMVARCHNPESTAYPYYGKRGITVCQRWRDSFDDFLADMGPRPSLEHSLDRYPNQYGNYEPGNVRWATTAEQARNRTDNRFLTAFGRTQCLVDWAAELGVAINLISDRIDKLGWDTERALTEEVHAQRDGLTAFGETLSLEAWARRLGIGARTIALRLDAGWSPERAVTEPARKGRPLAGTRSRRAA